jgi:type I restriction-modification system DNA methylase subunit
VRFKNHGLAPKSAADFAFLLHGFHFLKDEGVMAIILPHGVLFRGGAEERIRTKLLKDGHIDTVIGLPANLFYSTGIPVCILVLKKCKKPDDVLFINAAEHFEKGKRQNQLTEEHIAKIIDTYQFRKARRALLPPGGDGGDREERLQPQHLPLHQHGWPDAVTRHPTPTGCSSECSGRSTEETDIPSGMTGYGWIPPDQSRLWR